MDIVDTSQTRCTAMVFSDKGLDANLDTKDRSPLYSSTRINNFRVDF